MKKQLIKLSPLALLVLSQAVVAGDFANRNYNNNIVGQGNQPQGLVNNNIYGNNNYVSENETSAS